MYTYDKELSEDQISYGAVAHISYNKIPVFDKIGGFIDCSPKVPGASFAVKVLDSSMEPTFVKGSYVLVELNTPLNSKDYGIFSYNNSVIIRKFLSKKGSITLKADNKEIPEIKVTEDDTFYIIGKVFKNK